MAVIVLPLARNEAEVKSPIGGFMGVNEAAVARLLDRVDTSNGIQNPELTGVDLRIAGDEAEVQIRGFMSMSMVLRPLPIGALLMCRSLGSGLSPLPTPPHEAA
ncbi:hypothetical protein [Arthrobacter sp. ISL-28]|uniref:hypothetical protein n=1 Tax=Arthrobacter sp. ISL-28 TaxID=2819108 RepID=UPI001BE571CB|nr:hypothetical protein [Arthrobacter sp. ISL-28]MBT2522548.1 hypothetical protein [Arthrobacter sp. ISL-28]